MTMTTEQDGHLVRVRDAPALPSEAPSSCPPSADPDEATVRELIIHLAQVEHEMRNTSPISPRYTVLDGRERYLATPSTGARHEPRRGRGHVRAG